MRGKSNRGFRSSPTTKRSRSEVDNEASIGEELAEVFDLRDSISSRRKNKLRRLGTTDSTGHILTGPSPAATATNGGTSSLVLVSGLPAGCTVLELKSRFEMYGPVSRIRMEDGGSAFVTYRSLGSAQAAVSASLESDFGIFIQGKRVLVYLITEPQVSTGFSSSKLLRSEIPLSKHGRSNKKLNGSSSASPSTASGVMPFKGREIIAYDDLL